MKQGESYPYEIIKHNFRTLTGRETVAVVRGQTAAEWAVDHFNRLLTPEERDAGWSHYSQRTTKKPSPTIKPHVGPGKPERGGKRS